MWILGTQQWIRQVKIPVLIVYILEVGKQNIRPERRRWRQERCTGLARLLPEHLVHSGVGRKVLDKRQSGISGTDTGLLKSSEKPSPPSSPSSKSKHTCQHIAGAILFLFLI